MKQGVHSAPSQEEFLLYVVRRMCIKLQAIAKSRLPPCVPLVLLETLCHQCTSLQENGSKLTPWMGVYPNAYFGKSQKGWITTEILLTEHFIKYAAAVCPLLLLVDGHSSHIDVNTSKFCKENRISLYCLRSHSSLTTQPLDVGFYGPLKKRKQL